MLAPRGRCAHLDTMMKCASQPAAPAAELLAKIEAMIVELDELRVRGDCRRLPPGDRAASRAAGFRQGRTRLIGQPGKTAAQSEELPEWA